MTRRLVVLLAATALALAACEGGDGRRDAAAPSSTTTTTSSTPGDVFTSGRPLELWVDGEGFFVVRRDRLTLFTPAETFRLEHGTLATLGGLPLQGWSADGDGAVETNGPVGDIMLPGTDVTFAINRAGVITRRRAGGRSQTIGQVTIATFANPGALEQLDGSLHQVTADAGLAALGIAGLAGRGSVVAWP